MSTAASTTEQSRQVALGLIKAIQEQDYDLVPSFFAPDAVWWVNGTPPAVPYGGSLPASDRVTEAVAMWKNFVTFSLAPANVVAEGSKVMAELTVQGTTLKGVEYQNLVVMSFEIRDGKIWMLSEYVDHYQVEAFAKAAGGLYV